MVAEAEVDDLADKRAQRDLVILIAVSARVLVNFYPVTYHPRLLFCREHIVLRPSECVPQP